MYETPRLSLSLYHQTGLAYADALNAAFAEYTAKTMQRKTPEKPSVRQRLAHFKEVVKNMARDTARDRDRGGHER